MNIVLFARDEISGPISLKDPRACHIIKVLKRKPGDSFDAGVINGPRGKATLERIEPSEIHLSFTWGAPPPPLFPLSLVVGLPRPQTARKILNEATTLGAASICFAMTDRSEPSYAQSSLWASPEWKNHLIEGAAQAFCTRIPDVSVGKTLPEALQTIPPSQTRIALDNYEASTALSALVSKPSAGELAPVTLAFGSERGWTSKERDLLRSEGFTLAHLGRRVLRTETAVVAAVSIVRAILDWS